MKKRTNKAPETEETRDKRFKRIASKRTNDIIRRIRLIGNCSNRSGYDYDERQVQKIFSEIEREIREAKSRFTFTRGKKEFKL